MEILSEKGWTQDDELGENRSHLGYRGWWLCVGSGSSGGERVDAGHCILCAAWIELDDEFDVGY